MFDNELSMERLTELGTQLLERPRDCFAIWDDRIYTTHGPFLSWADRGDDIVSESNFRSVLAHFRSEFPDTEDTAWFTGSVSHWAVGSLQQIYVRVRAESTDAPFTPEFVAAMNIVQALRDEYPLFDESDYSDLEYEYWEKSYAEAVEYLAADSVVTLALSADESLAPYLFQAVMQDRYGWWEPGCVDSEWLEEFLPDAIRAQAFDLATKNGQVTLD